MRPYILALLCLPILTLSTHVEWDMRYMRRAGLKAVFVVLWLFTPSSFPLYAQHGTPPSDADLLRILKITTYRIRVPSEPGAVWDIQVLSPSDVKPTGVHPKGLTTATALLSFQEKQNAVYAFTLPERGGAFSQGEFDLCKAVSCEGQWSIKWLKTPRYSEDGTQCVIAEFTNLSDVKPSGLIALVKARSTP